MSRKQSPGTRIPNRVIRILQALLVTFLWSTSWIFIKVGLRSIPALTFAGLRYILAFLILFSVLAFKRELYKIRMLTKKDLLYCLILGVLFYAVTQGAQFFGLYYLPTVYVSIFLNFTPLLVLVLGGIFLYETPSRLQIIGILVFTAGIVLYFTPLTPGQFNTPGVVIMILGVLSNAAAAVLGRKVNREKKISPLVITTVSMGTGAVLLFAAGISLQGFPRIPALGWAIVLWLAGINTALAFTLWNKTLQDLTASESSILNSTMLIQIAFLAWIFLNERLSWKEITGILIITTGVVFVNLRKKAV